MMGKTHSVANLLHRFERIRLAKVVFAEEDGLGLSMVEPYHRVLPVAHVVAESHVEHHVSEIVAVKVEPKGVNDTVALVHDD